MAPGRFKRLFALQAQVHRLASSNPASVSTFETSFDCAKAHSYVENLVCSDQELAAADIQLASLFADAKAGSPDQAEFKQRARRA